MALLTSLYLCSRTVYAAVGTPTGSGARVVAAAQTELPEGCLINGVITNEADLTAALKEFFTANKLPMNHVALIAGGSQFMHRILTLPAMSEKKRMAVLSHELASGGAEVKAPLDDYMLLSRDAKTRVDTVLATRVEQSVIAGYDALAKAVGFKLYSIDLGLAAPIKAVRTIPDLQQKTFVLLQFDDDTISACLFVQGQYTYSTRSRLFNPRGSAESGTEIAQKLSGLIQFHTTSKSAGRRCRRHSGRPCGLPPGRGGAGPAGGPLPGFTHRQAAVRHRAGRCALRGGQPDRTLIFTCKYLPRGLIIMAMKQNNFYLRWQKAAGAAKSESRSQGLRALVPGLAVVAVSMLGWGVLTLHTSMLKSQREDILNWCSDNTEPYRAATQDSESAAQFRSLTDYSDGMTALLNSYPDVTSSLLHRVEAAGGSGITIQFTDYNASTGELLFNANSSQVIDIPAYIRSLQNCGVFSTVSYTGYKADDDGYSIDLRCVLAAPQQ